MRHLFHSHGKPYWLYCHSLYPIGKSVWGCFAQNVVTAIDIGIAQILALMNEGLAHVVVRQIVEILRGKGSLIDGLIAAIGALDDMLLNELHPRSPILPQSVRSCVWHASAHK